MRRARARRRRPDAAATETAVLQASGVRGAHALQRLQATIGNRAVARLLEGGVPGGPPAKAPVAAGTAVPKRPSDPAAQLKALHETAEGTASEMAGACYKALKLNIKAAGGFGDILDIYQDKRFKGYQEYATKFADAVDENGADALGLQEVEGSAASADPGTILVLKGGAHRISKEYGDISVVSGVVGANRDRLKCFNDGTIILPVKDTPDMVRAMYKPIVRPASGG